MFLALVCVGGASVLACNCVALSSPEHKHFVYSTQFCAFSHQVEEVPAIQYAFQSCLLFFFLTLEPPPKITVMRAVLNLVTKLQFILLISKKCFHSILTFMIRVVALHNLCSHTLQVLIHPEMDECTVLDFSAVHAIVTLPNSTCKKLQLTSIKCIVSEVSDAQLTH